MHQTQTNCSSLAICSHGRQLTQRWFRAKAHRLPQPTIGRGSKPQIKRLRSCHDNETGKVVREHLLTIHPKFHWGTDHRRGPAHGLHPTVSSSGFLTQNQFHQKEKETPSHTPNLTSGRCRVSSDSTSATSIEWVRKIGPDSHYHYTQWLTNGRAEPRQIGFCGGTNSSIPFTHQSSFRRL